MPGLSRRWPPAWLQGWGANGAEPDGDGDGAINADTFGRLRTELEGSGALPRLVEIFATQTPERLEQLRTAIEDAEPEVACRLAHTMKGGAASLGAVKMAEACKALEELAKSGSLEGASELVDALEQAFSDALDALNAQVEPVAP